MIRRLEPRDFAAVQQIIAESPEAAAWSPDSLQQIDHNDQLAWVIEAGGVIVGFLVARTVANDEAEILNLGVAQNHRRAGRASALLQACLGQFGRRMSRASSWKSAKPTLPPFLSTKSSDSHARADAPTTTGIPMKPRYYWLENSQPRTKIHRLPS